MKNTKFIKLKDCRDVKNLSVCIDSVECFFKSIHDYAGGRDKRSERDEYNFIRLKTGITFEIEESPDAISKLIQ